MLKKWFTFLFTISFLMTLFTLPAFASIRSYGDENNNFHRDHFYISKDENGHGSDSDTSGGIGGIDSNGFYNGWVDPQDESEDFKVWYKLDFSAEDMQRINKGDISAKVSMWVADTRSGLNDYAIFEWFAMVNGDWKSLDKTSKALEDSATWTYTRSIPVNSTALELDFSSDEDGSNDVEFNKIKVYFYDSTAPTVKSIQSNDSGTKIIGNSTSFTVTFDEAVNVTGTPKIKMNTGGYAFYTSGSGTDTLTFKYTVTQGEETEQLNIHTSPMAIELNEGTIADRGPNNASLTLMNKTNNLVTKNIRIDGKKPEIKSISPLAKDASGTASVNLNSGDTVTLTVSLTESVNVSGTPADIRLTLNNGKYAVCQATGNGINTLSFKYTVSAGDTDVNVLDIVGLTGGTIKDLAGNELVRTTKSIAASGIRVDNTPPKASFNATQNTQYKSSQSTKVTLSDTTATTTGSGLTGLTYKYTWSTDSNIANVNWSTVTNSNPGTGTLTVTQSSVTGKYYLHIRAVDIAGNVGYSTSGVFYLDNQGPVITLSPTGASSPAADYTVKVTVQDALSNLLASSLRYQWYQSGIDANKWKTLTLTSGTANISAIGSGADVHGNWKLVVEASDTLNNKSVKQSGNFFIDKKPPVITISPAATVSDDYHKGYSITVTAADPNDGYAAGTIMGRWYQWTSNSIIPAAGDVNWKTTSGTISESTYHGAKYLHVKAQDNSGNIAITTQLFQFDNAPPVIVFNTDGSETVQGSTTASISVRDDHSGLQSWDYQWTKSGAYDDTKWIPTTSFTFPLKDVNGDWFLSIRACDNVGNVSYATSKRFRMDNMPPDGGIDVLDEITNTNKVDIELWATDTNYPDQIEYRLSIGEEAAWSEWKTFIPALSENLPDMEGLHRIRVQYRDRFGNVSSINEDTVILDKTPPSAEIAYSTDDWTSGDVTAVLCEVTDTYRQGDDHVNMDPRKISFVGDPSSIIYNEVNHTWRFTFTQNGSREFTLRDIAGNESTYQAKVEWIDKTKPDIVLSMNSNSNPARNAVVTLNASDIVELDGRNLKTELPELIYYQWTQTPEDPAEDDEEWLEATNNTSVELSGVDGDWFLHVKAADRVGNTTILGSGRFLMDNTPPEANVTFDNTKPTANAVTAYISFNEPTTVTNPANGNTYYTFSENGEFTFEYRDTAGNEGTETIEVSWIDKSLPGAEIHYSTTDWTNQNVTVTVSVYDDNNTGLVQFNFPEGMDYSFISNEVTEALSVIETVYEIRQNGLFSFIVKDFQRNLSNEVNVIINNIDSIKPEGSLVYSETKPTRNDVEVSVIASDNTNQKVDIVPPAEAQVQNVGGNDRYVFSENGSYDFLLRDVAGNETVLTAEIMNIDREPPTGILTYSTETWTKEQVTVELTCDDTITILNNNGSGSFTFYNNGSFVFRIMDAAGNISEVPAQVTWIDKEPPAAVVSYSTMNRTNLDVLVIIDTSDNSGQTVQINVPEGFEPVVVEEKGQYLISGNGTYQVTLVDIAGNERKLTITVNNIDKTLPTAAVEYSTTSLTNENVEIRLTLSEEATVACPEGILAVEKDGNMVYIAHENGEYTFKLTDLAQNVNTITAEIGNIDKKPPAGFVTYSTLEPTRGPVIVRVFADEDFVVSNNLNSVERIFSENGSFTFTLVDAAGNIGTVDASVSNIDNEPPQVGIVYSTTETTNKNVTAMVESDEEIMILNNNGSKFFEFNDNGAFRFVVSDLLGNSTSIYAEVKNIDKQAPVITLAGGNRVMLETDKLLEGQIPARILEKLQDYTAFDEKDGDLTASVQIDTSSLDITKTGLNEVKYSVTDKAGNTVEVIRSVMMIDKNAYRAYVNGLDPLYEPMVFDKSTLEFVVTNPQGALEVKWKSGFWSEGSMKSMANLLEKVDGRYVFNAPNAGFYTFYIQDQERNTSYLQVFVQSVGPTEVK